MVNVNTNGSVAISNCCDGKSLGEIVDDWGICSICHDWTVFSDSDLTTEDFPDVPEKPEPFMASQAETDKERLYSIGLKCNIPKDVVEHFNPRTISWITSRIGVTSRDGVLQALEDGHFVINTAGEITNEAHVKIPVLINTGMVLHQLIDIANVMEKVMTTSDQKVVVHCAMGMERSVLGVVWYLATKQGMSLQRALKLVQEHRPIAQDRLNWIKL